jgi:hypothetical protein
MPNHIADGKRSQILQKLKERYFPIIPELQTQRPREWHELNRTSRSLAAFAIEKLADVLPAQGANALIDGGDDNGIDAIHFDSLKDILYVIQSKAGNAADMADNKKLCGGVEDLLDGRFDKFNEAFQRLQPMIETALNKPGVKVIACQVHRGEHELGPHAVKDLNQLKEKLNEFTERFDWREYGLDKVLDWLTHDHIQPSVNTKLTLTNWFGIQTPRRAFYGLASGKQLAELYNSFGKSLFEKNIRYYLGDEGVNEAIKNTVLTEPDELFYLNNGVTAICSSVEFPPKISHSAATFTVTGLSIVNGAQTVGSIASSATSTPAGIDEHSNVLFTLIEVGDNQQGIGKRITKARNTQNQIKYLHFVALDPNQERLRQEMAVSGIIYRYRPSEDEGDDGALKVETAMLALAAFQTDTRIVVNAKKQISLLYDIDGEIYNVLFRPNLNGIQLIRKIRIYLYLNELFNNSEKAENAGSRRKMFYRHGRLFMLHILTRRHSALLNKAEIEISEEEKLELSHIATDLAETIYTVGERMFSGIKGYLSIFNNQTDAVPLASAVMAELANHPRHS